MDGHGDPFAGEFATGPHHEGYKWDIIGELTMGMVEDLAHQPPNLVHWSVRQVNDMVDFNNNEERQGAYIQTKSHNAAYM